MIRTILILTLLYPTFLFAQNGTASNSNDSVFYIVEKLPEFPGGQEGLIRHLKQNTKYPAKAKKKKITGKVVVQFMIDTNGRVNMDSASVIEPVHPLLDQEALRVVSIMPVWKPGTQRGKPVNVYYKLPFNFKL
ncbi:MAG: energy transducer TonB [Flavobacteriales bacterium]